MKNIGRKNTQLILSGNIPKALLSLAIPIVINNFIQTMYNLTDTFWLGKLGTSEMAAIFPCKSFTKYYCEFWAGYNDCWLHSYKSAYRS